MTINETRKLFKQVITSYYGELYPGMEWSVQAALGPTDYAGGMMIWQIRITAPEERISDMLEPDGEYSLKRLLESSDSLKELGTVDVQKTSGHQLIGNPPLAPQPGATWTVRTLA